MQYLLADVIYTAKQVVFDTIVVVGDDGEILDFLPEDRVDESKVNYMRGALCPGFVNTHCHLELSYLHQKIEEGKGLSQFIKDIEKHKNVTDEFVLHCIAKGDEEMHRNGIVAVGDICNTASTFHTKAKSKIAYHNFIEVYSFLPDRAERAFAKGLELYQQAASPKSIVPHAPYSMSHELMRLVNVHASDHHSILSIHNQESQSENDMFLTKSGDIIERFQQWGFDVDFWKASGKTSIHYSLEQLTAATSLQFVHNTFSTLADIQHAQQVHPQLYWCICANANKYIENKLPMLTDWINQKCQITVGTDSLASNWSLNLIDEWKTIQAAYPDVDIPQLVQWSTLNGAQYLGMDKQLGSIEVGKRPGINLIEGLEDSKITANTRITKII